MRVLMTTDTVGGVWTFSRELASELLAGGDSVALVSFGRPATAAQRGWCVEMHERYSDQFLYRESDAPLEWMDNNAAAFQEGERILHEVADSFAPELLHSSQYCFGRSALRVPRLITAHSDVLSWADACRPAGLEESAWLDHYCELVQEGLDAADCVVSPTAWMRGALDRHFQVPCPSRVVPNGRRIAPPSHRLHRFLRAVSAGRLWDEAKGLTTLLQIRPAMPVSVAGEESFDGNGAPVQSRLQALGVLDEPTLLSVLRSSSVYIAASRFEPFGLAPLEAALCGCAVVARDIESLREVWGDAALYFSDAGELERLLGLLAEDPAALHQAQLAAGLRARQYSAERMASGYREVYRHLLRKSPSIGREEEQVAHAA